MKATYALVSTLRAAATAIEQHPENYSWGRIECCNLGTLARHANISVDVMLDASEYYNGSWSTMGREALCSNAMKPIHEVIQILSNTGLNQAEDYQRLEFLEDKNGKWGAYWLPESVSAYFRELANELEAQLHTQATVGCTDKQSVVVSC